ncbi:hypothetical protein CEXT_262251 [Caerostris extrusa]|uniref:BZIP domain-containing protein n=1 Tax=Caerostris extrusa TaxID=172846 RepID=A0AAV4NGA7_CAEEX|nr:hypothetical protein CEXT_262251 [Caerostris extrusa]
MSDVKLSLYHQLTVDLTHVQNWTNSWAPRRGGCATPTPFPLKIFYRKRFGVQESKGKDLNEDYRKIQPFEYNLIICFISTKPQTTLSSRSSEKTKNEKKKSDRTKIPNLKCCRRHHRNREAAAAKRRKRRETKILFRELPPRGKQTGGSGRRKEDAPLQPDRGGENRNSDNTLLWIPISPTEAGLVN